MPTEKIKTTHWAHVRTRSEQSIIEQIQRGDAQRAIPRDLLTGAPLSKNAQTMAGKWYVDGPRQTTAAYGVLPRTKPADMPLTAPTALDEDDAAD